MRIKNRSLFNLKDGSHKSYRIENKADESTVYIYDEISWFGVDANAFVKDFDAITSKTIHLRVNSPGGSIFDGLSIFNTINRHKSKVIAHVDGLAASIASVIVLAADEVLMAKNAFFMIHEAWSMVIGTAEDMRQEADLLEKVSGSIVQAYVDKSGKKESEILDFMAEETWFTADEALKGGFIDAIDEDENDTKKDLVLFDLSMFEKTPEKITKKELTEREIEDVLRDAGCSRKKAKAILAEGFTNEQRDAVDTPVQPKDLTTELLDKAEVN